MIIKIQSFTDIITNSSTEIFSTATDQTMKMIKEICQELIGEQKLEDVFEFGYTCRVESEEDMEDEDYDPWDEGPKCLSEEEYANINAVNESDVDIWIKSKDPKYDKFAENLSQLIDSYEKDSYYC